jgi:hypothetical protein
MLAPPAFRRAEFSSAVLMSRASQYGNLAHGGPAMPAAQAARLSSAAAAFYGRLSV